MPDSLSAFIAPKGDETESYRCQKKRPVWLLLQSLKRGSHAFRGSCINPEGGGNKGNLLSRQRQWHERKERSV